MLLAALRGAVWEHIGSQEFLNRHLTPDTSVWFCFVCITMACPCNLQPTSWLTRCIHRLHRRMHDLFRILLNGLSSLTFNTESKSLKPPVSWENILSLMCNAEIFSDLFTQACRHMYRHPICKWGQGLLATVSLHTKDALFGHTDKLAGWHYVVLVTAVETTGQHDLFTAGEEFTICPDFHHYLCACVSVENHTVLCTTSLFSPNNGLFYKSHTPASPGLGGKTETERR